MRFTLLSLSFPLLFAFTDAVTARANVPGDYKHVHGAPSCPETLSVDRVGRINFTSAGCVTAAMEVFDWTDTSGNQLTHHLVNHTTDKRKKDTPKQEFGKFIIGQFEAPVECGDLKIPEGAFVNFFTPEQNSTLNFKELFSRPMPKPSRPGHGSGHGDSHGGDSHGGDSHGGSGHTDAHADSHSNSTSHSDTSHGTTHTNSTKHDHSHDSAGHANGTAAHAAKPAHAPKPHSDEKHGTAEKTAHTGHNEDHDGHEEPERVVENHSERIVIDVHSNADAVVRPTITPEVEESTAAVIEVGPTQTPCPHKGCKSNTHSYNIHSDVGHTKDTAHKEQSKSHGHGSLGHELVDVNIPLVNATTEHHDTAHKTEGTHDSKLTDSDGHHGETSGTGHGHNSKTSGGHKKTEHQNAHGSHDASVHKSTEHNAEPHMHHASGTKHAAHGDTSHKSTEHKHTEHGDKAHGDGHKSAGHKETGHGHVAHGDTAHKSAGHRETGHDHAAHGEGSHKSVEHKESGHGHVAHGDSAHKSAGHKETGHGHAAHGDGPHKAVEHKETGHGHAAHGDGGHKSAGHKETGHVQSAHGDTTHKSVGHKETSHGDATHGDSAHKSTGHKETEHGHSAPKVTEHHGTESHDVKMHLEDSGHDDEHDDKEESHGKGGLSEGGHGAGKHGEAKHAEGGHSTEKHGSGHGGAGSKHSDGGHTKHKEGSHGSEKHGAKGHSESHGDTAHAGHSDTGASHGDSAHSGHSGTDTKHGDTAHGAHTGSGEHHGTTNSTHAGEHSTHGGEHGGSDASHGHAATEHGGETHSEKEGHGEHSPKVSTLPEPHSNAGDSTAHGDTHKPESTVMPVIGLTLSGDEYVVGKGKHYLALSDQCLYVQTKQMACFPAGSKVTLEGGRQIGIESLRTGDMVAVGGGRYSRVFMWTHRDATASAKYIRISTSSEHSITAAVGHYIHTSRGEMAIEQIEVGDNLVLEDGTFTKVVSTKRDMSVQGLYNPQTLSGDIVVDGFVASTYTEAVTPKVAHAALAPLRMMYQALGLTNGIGKSLGRVEL